MGTPKKKTKSEAPKAEAPKAPKAPKSSAYYVPLIRRHPSEIREAINTRRAARVAAGGRADTIADQIVLMALDSPTELKTTELAAKASVEQSYACRALALIVRLAGLDGCPDRRGRGAAAAAST